MSRSAPFSVELPLEDAHLTLYVSGTQSPYDPGVSSGPPEACYPPEGGEVEIEEVWLKHTGQVKPLELEVSSLLALLDSAECPVYERLEGLVQEKLANEPPDQPDYPDEDFP